MSSKKWEEKKISEVCVVNPSKSEVNDLSDDLEITFVPMKNVDDKAGAIIDPPTKLLKDVRTGYTYFREGDVIFAKITPCMENGKSALARNLKNGLGFGSTEFHVLRTNSEVLPEWVYYFIRQKRYRANAEINMTGTAGQQRVPKDFLEQTQIPVPPITTQKKVLENIRKLTDDIHKIEKLKTDVANETKDILASILRQVFFDSDTTHWSFKELKDLVEFKKDSIEPNEHPEKNFYYVSLEDIESDTGRLLRKRVVKGHEIKSTKLKFSKGLVLYSKLRPYLNKVLVADFNGVCTPELIPLEIKNGELLPKFLAWFLRTRTFVNYAMENVSGTRMPRIGTTALNEAIIPVPEIKIQNKIVSYLEELSILIENFIDMNQKTSLEINLLHESIFNKAFSGEL